MKKGRNCVRVGAAAVLCMVAMWLSPGTAAAQTPGSGNAVSISLEEALSIALEENPTIKIADMEIARQKYVKREALGGLYPVITAEGQYGRIIEPQSLGGSLDMPMDNEYQFVGSVNLPLFAPGVWQNIKLSKEQMYAAVESARGSRIALVAEVRKAFYNILMTEESLRVLRESEANITRTVEETQIKFDNGLASEYDLITAQVQLSNLRPNIIQTETAIEVSGMMLKMLMGLPQDVNVTVAGQLDQIASETEAMYDETGYARYVEDNSELKSMDLQKDILTRQLKIHQTQRMPTLSAFGTYTLSGNDMDQNAFNFGGPVVPQRHKYNWQSPVTVGLRVSIPIFSGFSKTAKAKQLRNSIEQLQLQRDYRSESLLVEVNSSIANISTTREQMLANRKTIEQAQKGYDISRTRQNAGMGTMLEVNTAELALTQARLNYTQAVYDYLSAVAEYDKVVGHDYEIQQ